MVRAGKFSRQRLGAVLAAIFILAMIMGTGPGIYLINPDPDNGVAPLTIAGVPTIYAWAVFWCAVQGATILLAYFAIWRHDREILPPGQPSTSEPSNRRETTL